MEDIMSRVVIKTAGTESGENSCEDSCTLQKEADIKSCPPLEIPGLPQRFEPIKLLGQGGMGAVYQVRDLTLAGEFAIKFMSAQSLPSETARQRFKIEAAAVHELVHPNIVQVYDYSVSDTAPYIVMEYIPGAGFDCVLARERIIEQQRLLNMILQICDALSYAHLHGVVHRDLKPSNIILHESSGLVKLVDFGIAKLGPQNESATQLTQKGEVFGSPAYMSPEQACAGKVDHRTDLYSLGCIMFEALSGKPLFAGENAVQILLQHINSSPLDLTRKLLKKGYSKSLVAIIEKLLEKEPDRRYQSAAELAEDIRRVLHKRLSFALMKKPFLISVSKNVVVATLASTCLLGMLGFSAYTTITVTQLRNSPNETRLFDAMVSKRNQAKEMIDKFLNGKREDRVLALRAFRALIAGQSESAERLQIDPKDQLSLVGAFNNESSQDIRKEILEIFTSVYKPESAVMTLTSNLCVSSDDVLRPLATSCVCAWVRKCEKRFQPELSTILSELLLRQADDSEDSLDSEGSRYGSSNLQSSIRLALKYVSNYSDLAIKNIRESAKKVQGDTTERAYYAPHPLVCVAKLKRTYYPELVLLLKSSTERMAAVEALAALGPKALPAVPDLLKLLEVSSEEGYSYNIYRTLGSIGPAVAKQAVPVLKASYLRHRMNEAPLIASVLAKMGPLGISALKVEADRKRLPYDSDPHSSNYRHNAAIDAAKEALATLAEN